MLHETDDNITTKYTGNKLRKATNELCSNNVDLDDFYLNYSLHEKCYRSSFPTVMARHCVNWLYTVRCECGSGGLRFINIVLKAIQDTMHRELTDMQYSFVKIIFDLFVEQRNLYMRKI